MEKQASQKACSLRPGPDWVPATIVEELDPVTYIVERRDQDRWKRHADQLNEFEFVSR